MRCSFRCFKSIMFLASLRLSDASWPSFWQGDSSQTDWLNSLLTANTLITSLVISLITQQLGSHCYTCTATQNYFYWKEQINTKLSITWRVQTQNWGDCFFGGLSHTRVIWQFNLVNQYSWCLWEKLSSAVKHFFPRTAGVFPFDKQLQVGLTHTSWNFQ